LRRPHAFFLLPAVLALSGCITPPYLVDRVRDAGDIFTVTVGTGGGAKVRVGPVQAAVVQQSDLLGLRAGQFFADGNSLLVNHEIYSPFPMYDRGRSLTFGSEAFTHGPASYSSMRGKQVMARSPVPLWVIGSGAPFYSEIEVSAGLALMLRVGVNAGELLDFLVGWTTADLYGDDIARRRRAAAPSAVLPRAAAPAAATGRRPDAPRSRGIPRP
jgi:hypothetical protein